MISGLVVVDKPAAWTSHDVVGRMRRLYGQKRVGHAGTLDPDATGVLLVGLGRATRLLRYLQGAGKDYRGEIAFGVATDTLDASGNVLTRAEMLLEREQVERGAAVFLGETEQLPPMVSAVKVGGRKLYEAARRGEEVERETRRIRIERFDIVDFEPGPFPVATVDIRCSSGTYIRSLAADLGTALGGCAHLRSLRRTAVGSYTLADAHTIEEIEADPPVFVLPPVAAVRDLRRIAVDAEQARAVTHGVVFPTGVLLGDDAGDGPFAVVDDDGTLLAVYERGRVALKPAVVLAANGD